MLTKYGRLAMDIASFHGSVREFVAWRFHGDTSFRIRGNHSTKE